MTPTFQKKKKFKNFKRFFFFFKNSKVHFFVFSGPWSECAHHTCGDGGVQRREVWCTHSSGWATLEANCAGLPRPKTQQKCFHICEFHRYHFLWKTGSWKPCRPKPNYAPCEDVHGIQDRNVSCVTKCGDQVRG